MTEEQMAKEYCNNEVPFDITDSGEKLYTENDLKYAFLAGLKAGKDMAEADLATVAYMQGAEFGYNKANEWHYVKDGDLPNTETKNYTYIQRRKRNERQFTDYRVIKCFVLCLSEKGKTIAKVGYFGCNQKCFLDEPEGMVYAWKEIVFPALPKEIKEND